MLPVKVSGGVNEQSEQVLSELEKANNYLSVLEDRALETGVTQQAQLVLFGKVWKFAIVPSMDRSSVTVLSETTL